MIIFNFLAWEGTSQWGEECKRGVYGRDKGEGVRELDQAMNEAAEGHGVYGPAGVERVERGVEAPDYNMIISVYLPDSIDWPAPVSPQLLLPSMPVQGSLSSPSHCASPSWKKRVPPPSFTLGKRGSDYEKKNSTSGHSGISSLQQLQSLAAFIALSITITRQ